MTESLSDEVTLIQLKRLVRLEDALTAELEKPAVYIRETREKLLSIYEIVLKQGEQCRYNPLVSLQLEIVTPLYRKYSEI